jgi:energy-coupling factor transport system permease protein
VILPEPLEVDPRAPLAGTNPVARLGAAAIVMAFLFVAIDPVTPLLVLPAVIAGAPASGIRTPDLLRRAWPLLVAAAAIGLLNAIFPARPSGATLQLGPLSLAAGSVVTGIGLGLRVMGIALAGIIAFATVEPIDLADALVQQLHAAPRFAVGALAAVRLLPILAEEWWILGLARRARGIDAGRSPIAWARLTAGRLFALLVGAIRRGTELSRAMDARGFDARSPRSVARPARVRARDWILLGAAVMTGAVASGISLAIGSYRFFLGG